jgi:hypothetical protein
MSSAVRRLLVNEHLNSRHGVRWKRPLVLAPWVELMHAIARVVRAKKPTVNVTAGVTTFSHESVTAVIPSLAAALVLAIAAARLGRSDCIPGVCQVGDLAETASERFACAAEMPELH